MNYKINNKIINLLRLSTYENIYFIFDKICSNALNYDCYFSIRDDEIVLFKSSAQRYDTHFYNLNINIQTQILHNFEKEVLRYERLKCFK